MINPKKGVPSGMPESGREALYGPEVQERLEAQREADLEWLVRPFVPKDLDKFRSTKVVTNLGDVLKSK